MSGNFAFINESQYFEALLLKYLGFSLHSAINRHDILTVLVSLNLVLWAHSLTVRIISNMVNYITHNQIFLLVSIEILLKVVLFKALRFELSNLLESSHIDSQSRSYLHFSSELSNGGSLLLPELFVELDGHGGWEYLNATLSAILQPDQQLGILLLVGAD